MQLADTLSRAYLPRTDTTNVEVEVQDVNMIEDLHLAPARLENIKTHTASGDSLQVWIGVIQNGCPPDKSATPIEAIPYYNVGDELSVQNGIILPGERAVIPKSPRRHMLKRIHAAHIGIDGCLRRARECVYWPSMSSEVKDFI